MPISQSHYRRALEMGGCRICSIFFDAKGNLVKIANTVIVLIVMAAASLVGIFAFKKEEPFSSTLYALCMALFVSSVFYAATVLVPDIQRRKRIRRALRKQYRSFKKKCIDMFLMSANSQGYEKPEKLLDHQEFKQYFSAQTANGQSRWELVAASMDDQDCFFDEIVRGFDFLSREITHARSSVDIDDDRVEDFFVNLNRVIHGIESAKASTDDYKHFCRNLWRIFTGWDDWSGEWEEDVIETMIDKI